MFTELHREEKRGEGDRGDQEEKRGNQKGRENLESLLTTVWNTQRVLQSYMEKRRERREIEVTRKRRGRIKR